MSMSRKDFEAIAAVIKSHAGFEALSHEAMIDSSMNDAAKAESKVIFDHVNITLRGMAYNMAAHFEEANPLFMADRFFEACGMRKYYDRPLAEAARLAYKNGDGADDSEYFTYAYAPINTYTIGPH